MSKYENLTRYLGSLVLESWVANFDEIEAVLGFGLPHSAYNHPAWWANQAGAGHSQSRAWQDIGWKTASLDLKARQVTFMRADGADGVPPSQGIVAHKGLSIAEARAGLAVYFGVPPESIEITIRG